MGKPTGKASKEGPPGSPVLADYQRVKGGPAEEIPPLPDDETIELERGAIIVLSYLSWSAIRWSVRWPAAKEKDAELGAGGFRSDVMFGDRDAAEAAAMKAYEQGPPPKVER